MLDPFSKYKILSYTNEAREILSGNFPPPRMVSCWLTTVCNYNCSFCLFKKENKKQHKIADTLKFFNFIDDIVKFGVRSLEFSGGGEPTLHPDFKDIVAYAYCRGLKLGLFTNGTNFPIGKFWLDRFKYIRIGLDAADSRVYNKIKRPSGKNCFNKTLDTIRQLVNLRGDNVRPRIGLKFVINNINQYDIEDMVSLGRDLKVDYVQFKGEHNGQNGLTQIEYTVSEKEIEKLKIFCHDSPVIIGSVIPKVATIKCFMSPIHSVIDPEGNVFVCCYLRDKEHTIGNAFKKPFSSIWGLTRHKDICYNLNVSECKRFSCRWAQKNLIMKEVIKDDSIDIDFN